MNRGSFLSKAGTLKCHQSRYLTQCDRLKRQLSFEKGDWRQDAGKAPLVPFNAGDASKKGTLRLPEPLSLAAFEVTHVDSDEEHRAMAAVNVSGVLILTVTRSAVLDFAHDMFSPSPEFNLSADSIRLKIIFERKRSSPDAMALGLYL
jgi:hypothetical protein